MRFNQLFAGGVVFAAGLFGSSFVLAADTATVPVSATVTAVCKFNTGIKSVSFTLDPSVGGPVTGVVSQPAFFCTKGSTFTITDTSTNANALSSTKRMKHATLAEFIPYTFVYTTTGTGLGASNPINMNIASSVAAVDYLNASAGSYTDTVTLSINP